MLLERPPVGGAQSVLEERVGVDGQEHAALHLEIGGPGLVQSERDGGRGRLGRLARPGERRAGRLPPGQRAGVHGLGAGDQHDVAVAAADGEAGVVHQGLRRVAADGRQHQLGRLVALGEPQARRHEQRRVDGAPSEGHHDPDAVGPPEERGPGRGGRSGRHPVAVLGRRPQRRHHQLQRFGPFGGLQPGVGRRDGLAGADHHGGARVEGHGPGSVPVRAPGAPRRTGRLGPHARCRRLGSCRVRPEGDPEGRIGGGGPRRRRPRHPCRGRVGRLPRLRGRRGAGGGRRVGRPRPLCLRDGQRDRHGGQQGPRRPGGRDPRRDHRRAGPAPQPCQRGLRRCPYHRQYRRRGGPGRLPRGAGGEPGGTTSRIEKLAGLDRELVHHVPVEGTP